MYHRVRILAACMAVISLAGCAGLQVDKQDVMVGAPGHQKQITYVGSTCGDKLFGSLSCDDRYDENGNLIAHDSSSNQGVLNSALQGATSGAVHFSVKYPERRLMRRADKKKKPRTCKLRPGSYTEAKPGPPTVPEALW